MIARLLPTLSLPTPRRWLDFGRGGLGALAVLVFAVPASPLARPHAVVFDNIIQTDLLPVLCRAQVVEAMAGQRQAAIATPVAFPYSPES